MAWNEPGNKDPWGTRKDQGPPDLDEIIRKLRQRLNTLFGGRRGGAGGKPNSWLGPVALIILIVWGLSGIYIVDPAERGVVLRFGKYVTSTLPGPHWHIPYPIERVEIVNVDQIRNVEIGFRSDGLKQTVESMPRESLMLTEDENIIDIRFTVQYRVKDAPAYLFNVQDPDFTMVQATESAVREVIGRSKVDFVLTEGRNEIELLSTDLIQRILDRYKVGVQITSVNMQNAQPPEEVQDAFQDAVRAIADQQRLINEAETYSNGIVPTARGDAARRIAESNAYKSKVVAQAEGEASRFLQVLEQYKKAPDVTRERLYLESMESVLSNTSKVLIDVEGNNNLMYLPLDRLLQSSGKAGNNAIETPENVSNPVPAPSQNKEDLRERDRSRGER